MPMHHHYQPLFADKLTHKIDKMATLMNDDALVVNDVAKFAVRMDVAKYAPEEISVKVVEHERDSSSPPILIVTGKHEEESADHHGHVSRSFTRRYSLPPDVDEKQLTCALNERGVLTVNAPRVQLPAVANSSKVHPIPIAHVPAEKPAHKDDHNDKPKSVLHKVFHNHH
ncbi:unnamed protein product [Sphagnum balticum]